MREFFRLPGLLKLPGFFALTGLLTAFLIALKHYIETPQPLDSSLPGTQKVYRWRQRYIFYTQHGSSTAPALLLLHAPGIGASSYEMREIIEPLAQHYQVYVPDLLGFGLSDRPPLAYTGQMYGELCRDFLRDVIDRPTTILTSQQSASYAIFAAAASPEQSERLVFISPMARNEDLHPALKSLLSSPLGILAYSILSTHLVLQAIHSGEDVEPIYASSRQFGAEHAPLSWLIGDLNLPVAQEMKNFHTPVLILWGTNELNRSPIGYEPFVAPHATLKILRDAGLKPHREVPERVVAALLEWVEAEEKPGIQQREETSSEGERAAPPIETPNVSKSEAEQPTVMAYCVKCRQKRPMNNIHEVTLKNERQAIQGECPICGTKLTRMGHL